ncbi:MAG: glutaredoxin domain-containing protein [Alphaproteobacteria bacterium]
MDFFQTYKEVSDFISKNKIVLFAGGEEGHFNCRQSEDLFEAFKRNNVKFACFNVIERPLVIDCLKKYTKLVTIPLVFINGKAFGGYDDVRGSLFSGEFFDIINL